MQYGGQGYSTGPSESYPDPYPTSNFRGRGRGRGRGSRGRGRGGNKAGYPTLSEHIQTLQVSHDARRNAQPQKAAVETKISKESLGEKLNSLFDVSSAPAVSFEEYDLNVFGYQEVIHLTYNSISTNVKHSEEHLSEPEFALCCGWLLYKRIFDILRAHTNVVRSLEAFDDVIAKDLIIPAPIAEYLAHLGAYKDETGVKILPKVYMPNYNAANDAGTLPCTGFGNNLELNKFTAMFPFAMYLRRFYQICGAAQYLATNNWAKRRVNPAAPGLPFADPEDALISRLGCYSYVRQCRNLDNRRLRLITPDYTGSFAAADNPRGRCLYSHLCMEQFSHWCTFISGGYQCRPLPKDTIGSKSVAAYCAPLDGDEDEVPTRFEFYSGLALSVNEMCLAAVMKYRIAVERDENCVDAMNHNDQLDTVNTSPAAFNAPGRLKVNAPEERNSTTLPFVQMFVIKR